jgi:fatty-acyl-CoA synthase
MNSQNLDKLSLPQLFSRLSRVVVCDSDGDSDVSGRALSEQVNRLCGGLEEWGIRRGDRIAVWLPNGVPYITFLWAAARLGVVIVSVNTRFRSSEVTDIVGRSGARLLVVDPSFLGIDFAGILARVDTQKLDIEAVVSLGGPVKGPWPTIGWDELITATPSDIDRSHPSRPWIVFTTSGTTSAPKLVLHRQDSPAQHACDLQDWVGPSVLAAVPLCGVFGYTMLLGAMGRGAELITMPVFESVIAAAAIERYGITTFHGSDEMLFRIVETGHDLSSLGPVGYARFNNALEGVVAAASEAGVNAVGLYGMSEVHAVFAQRVTEPRERSAVPGGQLISARARARVVDAETGKELVAGEDGELQLRGPSMFAGYLASGGEEIDQELTDKHFVDGWFRTGDLARMEDPTTFEYLARLGDVLRLGGFLVNPAEIEDCLLQDPTIEAVQVVGIDLSGGARPVAFVTSKEVIDEEALRTRCRTALAAYKVPLRILQLDAFPVTPSANGSKIQKVRLREMALAEAADL